MAKTLSEMLNSPAALKLAAEEFARQIPRIPADFFTAPRTPTMDEMREFLATRIESPDIRKIYELAYEFVREAEDTLSNDFQLAAEVTFAFERFVASRIR